MAQVFLRLEEEEQIVKWLLLLLVVLLVAGPLRRRFLRAWRFTFPAVLGGVVGYVLATMFVSYGSPRWLLTFGLFAGAFILGAAGKKWLDENLGPPKQGS